MDIKLVTSDDWQGLYINDELDLENHLLSVEDVLKELYNCLEDFCTLSFYGIDQDYMEEIGDLPSDFNDINMEYLKEECYV